MFGFFKKKAAGELPKPRTFPIPDFAIEEILSLVDMKGALGHYKLWKRIMELVPETKKGRWSLEASYPFSEGIYVEEIIKGE
ncbi:MAG: hypothetical protein AB7E55_16760 [Pigmentiphaga sp.]